MYQDLRLLLPAFLGETASVRQHNAAFAASVHVCGDDASVLSRERNVLLGKGGHRQNEGREERFEDQHQGIVTGAEFGASLGGYERRVQIQCLLWGNLALNAIVSCCWPDPACRSELPPLTRAAIGNGRAVIQERVWH